MEGEDVGTVQTTFFKTKRFIYLFERERKREREHDGEGRRNLNPPEATTWAQIKSGTLNGLHHVGALTQLFKRSFSVRPSREMWGALKWKVGSEEGYFKLGEMTWLYVDTIDPTWRSTFMGMEGSCLPVALYSQGNGKQSHRVRVKRVSNQKGPEYPQHL